MRRGGLFIEFEKLIPSSLECVLLCLPLGLCILVSFFPLFNISTGEVREGPDVSPLHLEASWNQDRARERSRQLWGAVYGCLRWNLWGICFLPAAQTSKQTEIPSQKRPSHPPGTALTRVKSRVSDVRTRPALGGRERTGESPGFLPLTRI